MLAEYGIDVVAMAPSVTADEGEHAALLRAFDSLADRERQEAAFYGSAEWRDGPRSTVMEPIESYHTVVLDVSPAAVDALRR